MPAALIAWMAYFQSWNRRAARGYLAIGIAISSMLAVTHVREAVQLAVYVGSFAIALVLVRPRRWTAQLAKAGVAVAALLIAMFAYTQFHQVTVHAVTSNEATHRALLRDFVETSPWSRFFSDMLPKYLLGWPTVFYGWIPVALALAPVVLVVYRRRPMVLLMAASLCTYLLLIRFPFFSVPFVYLTYSEILMAPARNLTYFAYLLTGVGVYWAATGLASLATWPAIILALQGLILISYLAREQLELTLLAHMDWFYAPVLLAFAVTLSIVLWRRAAPYRPSVGTRVASLGRLVLATAFLLLLAAGMTFNPVAAAFPIETMRRQSIAFPALSLPIHSPIGLLSRLSCLQHDSQPVPTNVPMPKPILLQNVRACPPTVEVTAFLRDQVGATAVVAANIANAYPLSAFAPVQIAAWPITTTYNLIDPNSIAPKYYAKLATAMERDVQPFFNAVETPGERSSFVADLGITHVVVDPMFHTTLMPILSAEPEYQLVFDQHNWAVFKVNRDASR